MVQLVADLDGDGIADLVTGAPDDATTFVHALLAGGTNTLGDTPDAPLLGAAGTQLGAALTTGDLDNDGILDLIVSEPAHDDGALRGAGALYVFLGTPTGVSTDAARAPSSSSVRYFPPEVPP